MDFLGKKVQYVREEKGKKSDKEISVPRKV